MAATHSFDTNPVLALGRIMQRYQAFKFQLIPSGEQKRRMGRFAGACRFVFNRALQLQRERYAQGEKRLGFTGLCKCLTRWRNSVDTPWLREAPVHPLQQALKDLERAYSSFFARRTRFPRFRKKNRGDSFRYPDPQQIKLDQTNSRIFLPKLGWLRYRNSREVPGDICQVTVSARGDKWFVAVQTVRETDPPRATRGGAVGIDMGIVRFATLSNGDFYSPLNSFRKHLNALRRAQQSLSRKRQFSSNWKRAKKRVLKIHARIGNARRDYLHKVTTTISQNHAIVCIEDLQVGDMSASAAGSGERPGRNVRAKSGLNRSILDQGWFEFRRQLAYKLAWRGGCLVAVPPAIPAAAARSAAMCRSATGAARRTSPAWIAVTRPMRIGWAPSISSPAGCRQCGTKGRARRRLAPGGRNRPSAARPQSGSPVK